MSSMSDYEFTSHATFALNSRKINETWVFDCLKNPDLIETDSEDFEVKHFFKKIPSNGNRVLRVILNFKADPQKVITVYFDRNMKGKI